MNRSQAQQAVQELKRQLVQRFGSDTEIYLFGSVARGDFEPLSDIDVMVLLSAQVNNQLEEEVFDIAYSIELKYDVVFGIVVYSKDFWRSSLAHEMPLWKSIEREGVLV